jgi:pilus assembly protein FimV
MAFGFGFNKQKVLSTAEKFVQQGKLQNAITEYEKILRADPKDLTVSNTVGDLYARLGENDKAVECFKGVGDAYATQGFTVKAIAMYKKLAKIKPSLESILRLAELYTQQGLFNDARAQYLQVAEEFLRAGELEQAVRIFQKTLEMDPENVAMRTRLAEVYVRLGKKSEAWQIFAAAAESLRTRGALPQAEEILERMLKLDPGNSYVLLLRGRTAFDSGDVSAAIENLEKVADLDSHPDGLKILLQAYRQTGRLPEAGTLAAKLATVHNDTEAIQGYASALMSAGQYESALEVYVQYCDRLLSAHSAQVLDNLHSLIGHLRDNTASLETLIELFSKAGENTHLTEVYELLAHAYVQSGELEKARDYYLKLTQLEPQNQLHANNYQQVLGKLGATSGSRLITAEEGAVMVDELEATAPFVDQRYADDVALAVRAALTDAELFISYNMPAKALGPLLSALPRAPRDLRLNQRLAALHTRSSRFAEAAVCCRTLESVYHDAGHPGDASRYGELAGQYEERAAAAAAVAPSAVRVERLHEPEPSVAAPEIDEVHPAMELSVPAADSVSVAPSGSMAEPSAAEGAEFEVQAEPALAGAAEIDLSSEWEGSVTEEAPADAEPEDLPEVTLVDDEASTAGEGTGETIEEIRFYLQHGMVEQAVAGLHKLAQLKADSSTLAMMQAEIAAAAEQAGPAESEVVEEVSVEDEPSPGTGPGEIPVEFEPELATVSAAPPEGDVIGGLVADLDAALGEDFEVETPAHALSAEPVAIPELHAAEPVAVEPAAEDDGALGEFVADLEDSLGEDFPEAPPAPPVQPRPIYAGEPMPVAAKAEAVPVAVSAPSSASIAPAAAAAAAVRAPLSSPAIPARPLVPPAAPDNFDVEAGINLADMFDELKYELEADTTAEGDKDPETHYSLGVAFREMGLLDEAIGELQKVCQAVDHGCQFPQIMQTYTWLAQCFLDKGVPEPAIRWYEKALQLPGLDGETRVALHYELASSYQIANNKPAALQHFLEVYGNNIDYRDVAERIQALKP